MQNSFAKILFFLRMREWREEKEKESYNFSAQFQRSLERRTKNFLIHQHQRLPEFPMRCAPSIAKRRTKFSQKKVSSRRQGVGKRDIFFRKSKVCEKRARQNNKAVGTDMQHTDLCRGPGLGTSSPLSRNMEPLQRKAFIASEQSTVWLGNNKLSTFMLLGLLKLLQRDLISPSRPSSASTYDNVHAWRCMEVTIHRWMTERKFFPVSFIHPSIHPFFHISYLSFCYCCMVWILKLSFISFLVKSTVKQSCLSFKGSLSSHH